MKEAVTLAKETMGLKKNSGKWRLTFDVPEEFAKTLKRVCAVKNITMVKYMIRAVLPKLEGDKEHIGDDQ